MEVKLPRHVLGEHKSLPGDYRDVEPLDPIPNSAVKRVIADGSVGSPHARVGHRQASNERAACCSRLNALSRNTQALRGVDPGQGVFIAGKKYLTQPKQAALAIDI